ncbi:MAG: cytochrome c oxidase assembly protein [Longimicrobiaceae bacterium]
MTAGTALVSTLWHPGTFSWSDWAVYPSFLIGWLLLLALYFALAGPLRRYFPGSRPLRARQVTCFVGAAVVMFAALQGWLHDLSDYFLFSAHMVQHLILILLMPPLLLAGLPAWMLRPALGVPGVRPLARWLTNPVVAFLLANSLFAAWHFPAPYDLMMRDHGVHVAMHLMIMAVGVVMWWPVASPLPELPRIAPPLQMVYLFVLGVPMMLVAALITFSGTPLYEWYVEAPRITPLSPLDDQRLGGVIMWVPGGLALWLSITVVYFRWSGGETREDERRWRGGGGRLTRTGTVVPPPFPQDR